MKLSREHSPGLERPLQDEVAGDDSRGAVPMCTDMGNAERLARRAAERLRYVSGLGWLLWDKRRWQRDTLGRAEEEAKTTVRGIYAEAATPEDPQERELVAKWAKQSEASARVDAMLKLARSDPRLRLADVNKLDTHADALNVRNGWLDLSTLDLHEHDPSLLLTKVAKASFDPAATCPFWESTVELALPDEEVRRWVQMAAGYSMLGSYSEWLFIPYGSGANLKSTFLYGIRHALGDYAMEAAPELLTEKRERNAGTDAALADLRGSRLVTTIETAQGKKMAEALTKQLTGETVIKAKFMRENYFEFENQAAIWLATNHKPIIQGTDFGIWRRVRLIPFTTKVEPKDQIDHVVAKRHLRDERDGILLWLVDGLRMYGETRSLDPAPEAVMQATEEYRLESDSVSRWVKEECIVGVREKVEIKHVQTSYGRFCEETGVRNPAGSQRFNEELEEMGFRRDKSREVRVWVGFRLRTAKDAELPLEGS